MLYAISKGKGRKLLSFNELWPVVYCLTPIVY